MSDLSCVFFYITELSKPAVAFLTELGTLLVNPVVIMHVVFDVIHLNEGNGYNNVHGIFTAPIAGLYHLTMALTTDAGKPWHHLHVNMMKSNNPIASVWLDDNTTDMLKRSATAMVHLVKGDDIWIKVVERTLNSALYGCCYTSVFSGFLIRADWYCEHLWIMS